VARRVRCLRRASQSLHPRLALTPWHCRKEASGLTQNGCAPPGSMKMPETRKTSLTVPPDPAHSVVPAAALTCATRLTWQCPSCKTILTYPKPHRCGRSAQSPLKRQPTRACQRRNANPVIPVPRPPAHAGGRTHGPPDGRSADVWLASSFSLRSSVESHPQSRTKGRLRLARIPYVLHVSAQEVIHADIGFAVEVAAWGGRDTDLRNDGRHG
jgi:hypothetical protein